MKRTRADHDYELRPAHQPDAQALLDLLSIPAVYEFLCDGAPPPAAAVDEWLSLAADASPPLGLWVLQRGSEPDLLGCVRLSGVDEDGRAVELTYVLHPDEWGRGVAQAVSRTVIDHAFTHSGCASVIAGADGPNTRSIAVMKQLGMQFARDVEYAAGPGVEYRVTRSAWAAMPRQPGLLFSPAD